MENILFCVSLLFLVAALASYIFAFLYKNIKIHTKKHCFFYTGLFLFFADISILNILFPSTAIAILYSIIVAAQMTILSAPYDCLLHQALDIGNTITYLFIILAIATPLAWGSLVVALFPNITRFFRFWIFHCFRNVYLFSALNENSLMLAEDLFKKNPQSLFIFCSSRKKEALDFSEQAYLHGFLLYERSIENFIRSKRCRKKWSYFFISENQDENLEYTKVVAEKSQVDSNSIFYLFSEHEEAPLVLASLEKKGFPVILVNRNRFIAETLVFEHPLFDVINNNEISVLLIGAGKIGKEILKTISWSGQFGEDYKLNITVLDKNADIIEKKFALECLEFLENDYGTKVSISFIKTDIETSELQNHLDTHCANTNYICVCLGNDALNIKTALYLRAYYMRKNVRNSRKPFIAVEVKNSLKNSLVSHFTVPHSKGSGNYNLVPFAANSSVYSTALLESPISAMAMNAHYIYELQRLNGKTTEEEARKSFYLNEVSVRSTRANVIHIKTKLFLLGYEAKPRNECNEYEKQESPKLVAELEERLKEPKTLLRLARIEHDRWNAYMRAEGWCKATKTQQEEAGSRRNDRAKLHACICSWDELDTVDVGIKKSDETFIQELAATAGLKQAVQNMTHLDYVLIKYSARA